MGACIPGVGDVGVPRPVGIPGVGEVDSPQPTTLTQTAIVIAARCNQLMDLTIGQRPSQWVVDTLRYTEDLGGNFDTSNFSDHPRCTQRRTEATRYQQTKEKNTGGSKITRDKT